MLEIPVCWAGYVILCAVLAPKLLNKFQSVYWPLAILMPIGMLASFMAGLALGETRLTVFKIPPSIWSYVLLAGLSFLAMFWINPKIIMLVILALPFISYGLTMILSGWLDKK